MKNKIIIVGDSYTFGHGCVDRIHYYDAIQNKWVGDQDLNKRGPSEFCWASLARRDFTNFKFFNLSQPGNSNDNMFKALSDVIDNDVALIIFAGTFANRILIKDSNSDSIVPWIVGMQWLSTYPQPKEYGNAKESFVKHLYQDSMGDNSAAMACIAAWGLSIANQTKFIWAIPQREPVLEHNLLSTIQMQNLQFPSIARYPFFEKFDLKPNTMYLAADGHVNDYGHNLYYETEIKPLLTRLLS